MTDTEWEENPFVKPKKKSSSRDGYEKLLKTADLSRSDWDTAQEHLGMIFTIARRFSKVYGDVFYDHLVSELLFYVPTIKKNYMPSKGPWKVFLSTTLGLRAKRIWRNKCKELNKEYATDFSEVGEGDRAFVVDPCAIEDVELALDFQEALSKLPPREAWLVHKRVVESLDLKEICDKWNETHPWHERTTFQTISRWLQGAMALLKGELAHWSPEVRKKIL